MSTQQPEPAPFDGPPPVPTPQSAAGSAGVPGSAGITPPYQGTPVQSGPTPAYGQPPQGAPGGYPSPGYGQPPQGAPGGYPPPAYGQPPQGGYAPPGYGQSPQGGYAPVPPSVARPIVNPLKGVPVADLVRDGLAFVLLLLSLALPWNGSGWSDQPSGDRDLIEVLLVTLLTAFAVAVPYLARAGAFPATWTLAQTRLLRLGIAVPYVLVVLIHVVIQAAGESHAVRFGSAVAFGLTGVVLIAQPRGFELDSDGAWKAASDLWHKVYLGLLGAVALGYLVTLIFVIKDLTGEGIPGRYLWTNVVAVLLTAAFLVVPAGLVILKQSLVWRRVLLSIGTVFLVIAFFGIDDESFLPRTEVARAVSPSVNGLLPLTTEVARAVSPSVNGLLPLTTEVARAVSPSVNGLLPLTTWVGLGFFLLPAIAAVAASPAFTRRLRSEDDGLVWVRAAAASLWLLAGVAVATAVSAIFELLEISKLKEALGGIDFDLGETGISTSKAVSTLVLALLIAAAASYAGRQLWEGAPEGRLLGLIAVVASFVLGIVILIVAPDSRCLYGGLGDLGGSSDKKLLVTFGHLALAFGLPAVVALALFAPKSVRARFAAQRPPAPAWAGAAAPAPYGIPAGQPPAPYNPAPQAAPAPAPYNPAPQAAPAPAPYNPAPQAAPAPAPYNPAPQAAPAPGHGFTAAQAADPATSGIVLAQIVQEAPELRAAVASNSSTYPALLEWLALVKDPAVDAALAARQR